MNCSLRQLAWRLSYGASFLIIFYYRKRAGDSGSQAGQLLGRPPSRLIAWSRAPSRTDRPKPARCPATRDLDDVKSRFAAAKRGGFGAATAASILISGCFHGSVVLNTQGREFKGSRSIPARARDTLGGALASVVRPSTPWLVLYVGWGIPRFNGEPRPSLRFGSTFSPRHPRHSPSLLLALTR